MARNVSGGRSAGGNGSSGAIRSIGSSGSILSVGSTGSILSVGSTGSILSVGSAGSFLSIGSVGSVLSVASAASIGSVLSVASRWSIRAYRSDKPSPLAHHHRHAGNGAGPADPGRGVSRRGSGRHGAFRPPDWLPFLAR